MEGTRLSEPTAFNGYEPDLPPGLERSMLAFQTAYDAPHRGAIHRAGTAGGHNSDGVEHKRHKKRTHQITGYHYPQDRHLFISLRCVVEMFILLPMRTDQQR